ncbi:MAG: ATP-grasp domain-containing protein [Clostridiales bacterium]|nr:ATP-grasp domain-containing protein [Clostridiales bacterium]
MSKYRVLLFEGRARQSLPLAEAFKKMDCEVTALCESKLDVAYVSRYFDNKLIGVCSNTDEEGTAKQVEELVKTGEYDLVVPTTDFSAMILAKYRERFIPYCHVASNEWSVFQIAADKNKTMKVCTDCGLPCPRTLFDVDSIDKVTGLQYPIVVKPKTGYGAIGFKKVNDRVELEKLLDGLSAEEIRQFVFQEYIPQTDLQYECAMFMDDNNEAKTALVFSKNRWFPVEGGSSTLNITVERADIVESCTKLLQAINWRGAADIDLIQDPRDGTAKIMEINPRVSGSVKIAFIAGTDQARQMIELAEGKDVTAYREYEYGWRLRCFQTDLLWFLKSKDRFKAKPSWFSWKRTREQIFSFRDPIPWFAFSIKGIKNYRSEMKKRTQ